MSTTCQSIAAVDGTALCLLISMSHLIDVKASLNTGSRREDHVLRYANDQMGFCVFSVRGPSDDAE